MVTINNYIDEDTTIKSFVNEMETNTKMFMKLMNLANNYDNSNSKWSNILVEQDATTIKKLQRGAKKYGTNYMRIVEVVYDTINNNIYNNTVNEENSNNENDVKNSSKNSSIIYNSNKSNFRGNLDDKINTKSNNKNGNKEWFFSNIIFFTNETDSKKNKTLKNLEDAVKGKNINIIKFLSDEVSYKATSNSIEISDSKTTYKIKEQSNIDTICIVRLGAQDNEQCVSCIKEIQNWGIFTLNPIEAACTASNKYETSVLLEKYNIPQPKFALLTKTDIEKGEESLVEKLDVIYPGTKEKFKSSKKSDKEEIENQSYVVKILDGHGGTGVFMLDGKKILAVLQAIFAIDEERELLLQRKEEADGGDIRVHVMTFNGKYTDKQQKIIAAMKRVKIDGDFRSNVSLGASAEKVELTKEQEEIALNTALISGMPWCAVDIMPLKKGSNKELGDNVVLEYNSSPGTDGISEVIGENFVTILLNTINEYKNYLPITHQQIGFIENVNFVLKEGEKPIKLSSKFDTGNGSLASTLNVDNVELSNNEKTVTITINNNKYIFDVERKISPKVGVNREERPTIIIPEIMIGTRKLKDVEVAVVTNRKDRSTPVLINRQVMRQMGFVIDPNLKNSIE